MNGSSGSPEDVDVISDFLETLKKQHVKLAAQKSKESVKPKDAEVDKEDCYEYVSSELSGTVDGNSDEDSSTPEQKAYFVHKVTQADTIQGLVLRYGVSFSQLRQLNHMTSDRLTSYSTLKIPKVPTRKPTNLTPTVTVSRKTREAKLIQTFKSIFPGLGESEIRFYLADSKWNLEKAVRECELDFKWEKERTNSSKSSNSRDSEEDTYNKIESNVGCGAATLSFLFSKRRDRDVAASGSLGEHLLTSDTEKLHRYEVTPL
mmetsp:Transcript_9934/g.11367  ORF Transcript_9934/g.11367 Transcript_9934/m.11367 type:complete len:261 (+) Transcript_9934:330-1112(+)